MELFQLAYVEMLARTCNFSKAAEKLFITQPALSQQLQRLEQEIGFPLFARSSKSVSLTLAGKEFLAQAKNVLRAYEQLGKTVQALSGSMSEEIVFGASALSSPHISDGLSAFFNAYPNVKLSYVETWDPELLELVKKGEIDVALLCLPHASYPVEEYRIWPIRDEYICIVVNRKHPLAARESVSLGELLHERLVFTSPGSGLRALLVAMLQKEGITDYRIMDLISLEARLSLVRSGAVTFVMNEQFKLYMTDEFSVIPIEPKVFRTFALISSRDKGDSFLVNAFVDSTLQRINTRLKDAADSQT